MKTVAIMQPYFLPYIGYWQLINAADEFVVYDNIKYVKGRWFNRNRILEADHDRMFTIPLKKDSDNLNVNQRFLSDDSVAEIQRQLRIIENTYRSAPNFKDAFAVIKECFENSDKNLFGYDLNSIKLICEHLKINTPLVVSSSIDVDHSLKAENKVLAISKKLDAEVYINPIGGLELYNKQNFSAEGIDLKFIRTGPIEYKQFDSEFVPSLSIIDVMMFNSVDQISKILDNYELV